MIEQIVIVGFGCIGQAVLPLLERAWPRAAITVVDRVLDVARRQLATSHGLDAIEATRTCWKPASTPATSPASRTQKSPSCRARARA